LEALPRVVPVEDEEISAELEKAFKKKNIRDTDGLQGREREEGCQGVTVTFTDKDGKRRHYRRKIVGGSRRMAMTDGCGRKNRRRD